MIEKLHQNLVYESLTRRIKFAAIQDEKSNFDKFAKKFKNEKSVIENENIIDDKNITDEKNLKDDKQHIKLDNDKIETLSSDKDLEDKQFNV